MRVFSILGDGFGYILLGVTLGSLAIVGVRRLWRAHPAMQGDFAYLALCLFNDTASCDRPVPLPDPHGAVHAFSSPRRPRGEGASAER